MVAYQANITAKLPGKYDYTLDIGALLETAFLPPAGYILMLWHQAPDRYRLSSSLSFRTVARMTPENLDKRQWCNLIVIPTSLENARQSPSGLFPVRNNILTHTITP